MSESFHWFRAFRRDTPEDVLQVLLSGDTPNPAPHATTRLNEEKLGITPACVYFYLGILLEKFGKNAVSIAFESFEGEVSPFDTGGIVNHMKPVCGWSQDEQRKFLADHSWPSAELAELIKAFPGMSLSQRRHYLQMLRPPHDGPSKVISGLPEVPLWAANDTWRSWVWEGRRPQIQPFGKAIVKWTCPPEVFSAILQRLRANPIDPVLASHLVGSYVRGGPAALLESMRALQEAA